MPQSNKKRMMMIDIETLDTARTAVVIQVAAIVFEYDLHGYYKEIGDINIPLCVGKQVSDGRTVSASTVAWWLSKQNHAVFGNIISDGYALPEDDGLVELKSQLNSWKCDEYWFQGPTFDAIILEDLIGTCIPWKYYQVRDQRTVDNLARDKDMIKSMKSKINHDAIEDVRNQISRLMFCIRENKPMTAPAFRPGAIKNG